MGNVITLTDDQMRDLKEGKPITIVPPRPQPKHRTKIYVNHWDRMTYKTTEACRIYDCCSDSDTRLLLSNFRIIGGKLGSFDYPVADFDVTTTRVIEMCEGGYSVKFGGIIRKIDENLVLIMDECHHNVTVDTFVNKIAEIASYGPREIHIYGYLPEVSFKLGTHSLLKGRRIDVISNVRQSPSDLLERTDINRLEGIF